MDWSSEGFKANLKRELIIMDHTVHDHYSN